MRWTLAVIAALWLAMPPPPVELRIAQAFVQPGATVVAFVAVEPHKANTEVALEWEGAGSGYSVKEVGPATTVVAFDRHMVRLREGIYYVQASLKRDRTVYRSAVREFQVGVPE